MKSHKKTLKKRPIQMRDPPTLGDIYVDMFSTLVKNNSKELKHYGHVID
jgi:hypothetical protein